MDVFNFNPPNRNILIDGDSYKLSPFSLKIMTIVNSHFGSLQNFDKVLKLANEKDGIYMGRFPDSSAWLCYILLTEKDNFPSICFFKKKFTAQKQDIYEYNIGILFSIIKDSQTILSEQEDVKLNSDKETNEKFSLTYARISREIKFTPDEFYDLTARQINQISADINNIKTTETKFEASLHGHKLQKSAVKNIEFSKEDDDFFDDFGKKQLEKLKNERDYS